VTDQPLREAVARAIALHLVSDAERWREYKGPARDAIAAVEPLIRADERERVTTTIKAIQSYDPETVVVRPADDFKRDVLAAVRALGDTP